MSYEPSAWVDRSKLRGHDAVPQAQSIALRGERSDTLWWPTETGGGGGSASPAHGRAFGDLGDASTSELIHNVYEGLELPGEPSDYHFLIQGCASELWRRRREEPSVIGEVEKLCWLDISLVKVCPRAVTNEYGEEHTFYSILVFGVLTEIYEREGCLAEALEVAELAARYGQGDDTRQRLLERIQAVENEAVGDRS